MSQPIYKNASEDSLFAINVSITIGGVCAVGVVVFLLLK